MNNTLKTISNQSKCSINQPVSLITLKVCVIICKIKLMILNKA